MSRFLSERFASLEAYTPGEQPRDKRYVKLNTNESPFPPSPGVMAAIHRGEVEALRLYSDPTCLSLRRALASLFSCDAENIIASNGSDDLLNFAFMAFTGGGESVVFPDVSYGFYEVYAALHGASYRKIPLREDFTINPDDYCNVGAHVVIANPNAPTGICLSQGEIERIVRSNPDHVVLIDEAYVDFGGESAVSLIGRYDNLLVVRTFSKSASLAGARLGFAVGNRELIADLERIKYSTNPYSINRLTLLAGVAAVEEKDYYRQNCRTICENREYTASALRALGFHVTDSKANFVFAASDRIDGDRLYRGLRERGILVRHFTSPRICRYNRITVGTREDMDALLDAVRSIIREEEGQ